MRPVTDPVALASVRWLTPRTLPEVGSTMGATVVFEMGNDAEVVPGWPATGQHFSLLLTFTNGSDLPNVSHANIDFFDRQGVGNMLVENARFLLMAGPQPIAEGQLVSILWKREG